MKIKDQKFDGEDIDLDGNEFHSCTFNKCTMIFRGKGGIIGLENCAFIDVKWSFADGAGITLAFMRTLVQGTGDHGKYLIINTFPEIKEWLRQDILDKMTAEKGVGI